MKKKHYILPVLFALFIGGCGCSKIDESTYENAIKNYKNSNALSYTRVETHEENEANYYTRKISEVKFNYTNQGQVYDFAYEMTTNEVSRGGGSVSNSSEIVRYYYSGERNTFYTYKKIGETSEIREKESSTSYTDKFNVNTCLDNDCRILIATNLVPILGLDEVTELDFNKNGEEADFSFKGMCPSFENCASSSQVLDYKVTIDSDGNLKTLDYVIERENDKYTISYTFFGFSKDNVKIDFPNDLESYIEKVH